MSANAEQIEEICRLVPERRKKVLALVEAGLSWYQANDILAAARRPLIEPRRAGEELRRRHQATLDLWGQQRLFAQEQQPDDPVSRYGRFIRRGSGLSGE